MDLTDTEKHRVIHKFFPTLKGHLLEGSDLEGYFVDAISRAQRKGWTNDEIERAAKTRRWKKVDAAPSQSID